METMIASIVAYLAGHLSKNKSIKDFINEFSSATVTWISPLFLKADGTLEPDIKKLAANTSSTAKKKRVETLLISELEDAPHAEAYIKEMYEKLQAKNSADTRIIKNVVYGTIETNGGSSIVGDNSTIINRGNINIRDLHSTKLDLDIGSLK